MNLIQVQDRLKDMPTQAIMSYANGSNPDVPPYLALGELNRRKQMEQKQVQAPQGTVKDQIEQSVKLAQAQKAAQAQGQQKMTEAMGAQQTPVPGGTPQPQEQPEAGIAQLPTGPMNFRDGGIVSFADNPNQPASENMPSDEEERQRQARLRQVPEKATSPAGDILRSLGLADLVEGFKSSQRDEGNKERSAQLSAAYDLRPGFFESLTPTERERREKAAGILLKGPQAVPKLSQAELAAKAMAFKGKQEVDESQLGSPVNMMPPAPGRGAGVGAGGGAGGGAGRVGSTGGGRAPGGASPAGAPPMGVDPLAKLMERIEGQTTQLPKSPDELRAERAKTDQYLNTLPGSRLEELHAQIAKRDEEDRARFLKNEEERKQGRLNRGLMAGAEATRGQGGLGALGSFFMGFNKANEAEDESARTRMDAQRALERQQEVLRAEVLSKVEDARIARSEGRLKDAVGYEKEAAAAQNQLSQTKLTQLTSLAQAVETRRHNIATEEGQREQLKYTRMAASRGPEIQQVFSFLSKQFPDKDPKALLDMALQYSGVGARLQAADTAAITKADAAFEKQNALAITQANIQTDPAKKKKMEDDLEAKRAAFRQSYQVSGGIGGLPAGDPYANFTVK